jgi:microcystin-dependent protein
MPANKIPICLVYQKTTMTKVLDFEDKDTDATQGYILADVRPFMKNGFTFFKGADVASASTVNLGNDGNFFNITGTTTITSITAKSAGTVVWLRFTGVLTVTNGSNLKLNGNFVTAADSILQLVSDGTNWYEVSRQPTTTTFLGLNDTPSSYSGQANKFIRVNPGETGLEFVAGIPVGLGPLPWPTDTPPSGWLLCDGSAVSRTTYAALFAVIGTTFGSGDGSTTFNLPDMRGRIPLGQDDMGGVSANRVTNAQADTIGGSAGAETHQLTIAQMPSHNHGVQINDATSAGPTRKPETAGITNTYAWPSDYTGGDQAHNNMQPYLTMNYIIKH